MGLCGSTPAMTAEEKEAEEKSKKFDGIMVRHHFVWHWQQLIS
jgi:hypothetical protein